ncbi:MAG: VCBS repeat-containing protein [Armatimonadota bacterium]|nr:VCBS repeat-containing protein [Armatimonadota bacterium]
MPGPASYVLTLAGAGFVAVVADPSAAAAAPQAGPPSDADTDLDGLPDAWEQRYGLDPLSADGDDGADGDPDADGVRNADELIAGTHPLGRYRRYFAEGARGYFSTTFSLANANELPVEIVARFFNEDGTTVALPLTVQALSSATLAADSVAGLTNAFSAVFEFAFPVGVTRRMTWNAGTSGHADAGAPQPERTWYFAEGATHSGFELFYLVLNPGDQAVTVSATYVRRAPAEPVTITYDVGPRTRRTIWVNVEHPILDNDEFGATFVADQPIVVERSMYLRASGGLFGGGHNALGAVAPAPRWFLAEGATGVFFDAFLLVANPGADPVTVRVRYLLPSGTIVTRDYGVEPASRYTIWVDHEAVQLADTALSFEVECLEGRPIVVERAMWWAGPTAATWYEGHVSPGLAAADLAWLAPGGEAGDAPGRETYVLIGNVSPTPGQIRATVLFEDGRPPIARHFGILPSSRFNLPIGHYFTEARNARFSVFIESVGIDPAWLVVEVATYADGVRFWSAGTAAAALPLPRPLKVGTDVVLARGDETRILSMANPLHVTPGTRFTASSSNTAVATVAVDEQTGELSIHGLGQALGSTIIIVTADAPDGERWQESFAVHGSGAAVTFDAPVTFWGGWVTAVADVDGDGDVEPFGTLNQSGVLVPQDPAGMGLSSILTEAQILVNRDNRVADFTGDGIPDVVTTVYTSLDNAAVRAHLFVGLGDGTFAEDPAFAALDIRGYGETVVAADFDNDGDLDLFLPHYTHNDPAEHNYLLINDGRGRFTDVSDAANVAMRNWPVEYKVEGAQAVDFNLDGWIDLFVGSHFFINNGNLTFTDRRADYGLPLQFEEGLKFLDWNNDGYLDLVLHDPWGGPILYSFNGSTFARTNVLPPLGYLNSFGVNIADLNNDGREDIVCAGGDLFDTVVLVNTGAGFLRNPPSAIDGWGNDVLAFGDIDGDGRLDLVKRHQSANDTLSLARNATPAGGTGHFVVEVVGARGERNQQGRVVKISPVSRPDVVYTRVVDSGSGFLSQNQYALLVGTWFQEPHTVTVYYDNGPVSFTIVPGERVRVHRGGLVTPLP